MKVTEGMIVALLWFTKHEPVGLFNHTAPSRQMRTKLEKAGLIEEAGPRHGTRLLKYRVSHKGLAALAERA